MFRFLQSSVSTTFLTYIKSYITTTIFFQFHIKNWVLQRCSKTNLQTFVNDLMHAQYSTPYMDTNSLTGHKASKETDSATRKESMNPDELKQVIGRILLFCFIIHSKN